MSNLNFLLKMGNGSPSICCPALSGHNAISFITALIFEDCYQILLSFFYPRLNNPSTSTLSWHVVFSRPLVIFIAFLWTLSYFSLLFLKCSAPNRKEYSREDLPSTELGGRITSNDLHVTLLLLVFVLGICFCNSNTPLYLWFHPSDIIEKLRSVRGFAFQWIKCGP